LVRNKVKKKGKQQLKDELKQIEEESNACGLKIKED